MSKGHDNKKFLDWLRKNGAEVLAPTNPYEFARFIAHGSVNVVYTGRRGFSANGFARKCLEAFFDGMEFIDMGIAKTPRTQLGRLKHALRERDGLECFFCRKHMTEQSMTVEHLVAKQNGGPDHMDNLALAHAECNRKAANHPLMEKIKIRESIKFQERSENERNQFQRSL